MSAIAQRARFAGRPIPSKHNHVLHGHGPYRGTLRPRSRGCRLATRSGHLVPAGTRAAPFRPRGQPGLARIQLAPAPPSAGNQGFGRIGRGGPDSDGPAGLAAGEGQVQDQSEVGSCFHVGAVPGPGPDDALSLSSFRSGRLAGALERACVLPQRRERAVCRAPRWIGILSPASNDTWRDDRHCGRGARPRRRGTILFSVADASSGVD